jgi:hypothetical protein
MQQWSALKDILKFGKLIAFEGSKAGKTTLVAGAASIILLGWKTSTFY